MMIKKLRHWVKYRIAYRLSFRYEWLYPVLIHGKEKERYALWELRSNTRCLGWGIDDMTDKEVIDRMREVKVLMNYTGLSIDQVGETLKSFKSE